MAAKKRAMTADRAARRKNSKNADAPRRLKGASTPKKKSASASKTPAGRKSETASKAAAAGLAGAVRRGARPGAAPRTTEFSRAQNPYKTYPWQDIDHGPGRTWRRPKPVTTPQPTTASIKAKQDQEFAPMPRYPRGGRSDYSPIAKNVKGMKIKGRSLGSMRGNISGLSNVRRGGGMRRHGK